MRAKCKRPKCNATFEAFKNTKFCSDECADQQKKDTHAEWRSRNREKLSKDSVQWKKDNKEYWNNYMNTRNGENRVEQVKEWVKNKAKSN